MVIDLVYFYDFLDQVDNPNKKIIEIGQVDNPNRKIIEIGQVDNPNRKIIEIVRQCGVFCFSS
jgi:hypothetical protein